MRMFADRFDPRAGLPNAEHQRLLAMAGSVARRLYRELLANLGIDDDAVWRAETDRDAKGWTADERERFTLIGVAGSPEEAQTALTVFRRQNFARWLVDHQRIGAGDEVRV